ncbi:MULTISPECIES: DUF4363 family protein [unclassified Sedimentibacter]|uniref:DUF4363 family protein n=1 Tax=unclassified Sedimentibacter TaxID=2649220 RepID=UPI0027E1D379|nr:DUF4363 family protein [Sedimentibacter sp. MB35-C1]WMJ77409.1 DUF4363 family protein [Sedimentibacter sp. MB35-C1]
MRKFLVISIPIVTTVLFILVMLSDKVLKNPLTNDDNIPAVIDSIRDEIKKDNWAEASNKALQLTNTWDKITKRVQFSAEKDEINGFYKSLARLNGAIEAKDMSDAFMELNEAYEHWVNLGK